MRIAYQGHQLFCSPTYGFAEVLYEVDVHVGLSRRNMFAARACSTPRPLVRACRGAIKAAH
eukprot:11194074-Lingulodinium_polyedra.AAC.1